MKFQFVCMVNVQIMGECEGIGDDMGIMSHPTVLTSPAIIHMPIDIEEFKDEETRDQVFAAIVHHALQRAEVARRPLKNPMFHEPIPVSDPKDPNKRN